MADRQIRRVVIVGADGACVGVVAQADLVRARDAGVSDGEVARVLEKISEPSHGGGRAGNAASCDTGSEVPRALDVPLDAFSVRQLGVNDRDIQRFAAAERRELARAPLPRR